MVFAPLSPLGSLTSHFRIRFARWWNLTASINFPLRTYLDTALFRCEQAVRRMGGGAAFKG